jgi:hypothetical protein
MTTMKVAMRLIEERLACAVERANGTGTNRREA